MQNKLIGIFFAAAALLFYSNNPEVVNGWFTLNSEPEIVIVKEGENTAERLNPDDVNTVEDAEEAVEEHDLNDPDDEIAEAIPPTLKLEVGDMPGMEKSIRGVVQISAANYSVSTALEALGMGIWCEIDHDPKWFSEIEYDPSIPAPIQLEAGIIGEDSNSRYCPIYIVQGTIYAGIKTVNTADLNFYSTEELNTGISPEMPYVQYEVTQSEPVLSDDGKELVTTESISMTLHVYYGAFAPSIKPDEQVKNSLANPWGIVYDRANIEAYLRKRPSYTSIMNYADSRALQLAIEDLFAPIDFETGARDMTRPASFLATLRKHFSGHAPEGSGETWIYTTISQQLKWAAKDNNFSGVGSIRIVLHSPSGIDGEWFYLDSIGSPNGLEPIIKNNEETWQHNFYPIFRAEIQKRLDFIPNWAFKNPGWGEIYDKWLK